MVKFLTNGEIADALLPRLTGADIQALRVMDDPDDVIELHFITGRDIRNEFYMWRPDNPHSVVDAEPNAQGVIDHPKFPDQRSHEVLKLLWHKVRR
jgi:hypothetical protein